MAASCTGQGSAPPLPVDVLVSVVVLVFVVVLVGEPPAVPLLVLELLEEDAVSSGDSSDELHPVETTDDNTRARTKAPRTNDFIRLS